MLLKINTKRIYAIVVVAILGYLIVTFFITILPPVWSEAHSPCVAYFTEDGCLEACPYSIDYEEWNEIVSDIEIEIWISMYQAHMSGGGCYDALSNTSEVVISNWAFDPLINHIYRRDGENLVIDETVVVKKGEMWEDSRLLSFWNPWRLKKETISLTNHGIVSCNTFAEDPDTYGPALVVIGEHYRTYYEFNYINCIELVVLSSLAVLFGTLLYIKRRRKT